MKSLDDISIAEAGKLFRAHKLSPVELIDYKLSQIQIIDPHYNAFLSVTRDIALKEAKQAEAEIFNGRIRGPMHGIPFGLKDNINVEGLTTTAQSRIFADNVSTHDASIVQRLRAAGAILLGKLTLDEFAAGGPVFDQAWPPARNPWNRMLHVGGSSSGCAVAVKTGMIPAAIGTDTGGSIRNPSTCAGIVGLKPTYGVVGRSGVFPVSFSMDHVGPMTRTVEDNAIVFEAIVGKDPADPTSVDHPNCDCLRGIHNGIKDIRIGVLDHFYTEDIEARSEMRDAIKAAIGVLEELGAKVQPARLSPLQKWFDCGQTIIECESYAIHENWLRERPEDYSSLARSKISRGAFYSAAEYIKAVQARSVLCAEFATVMRNFDVVVTLSGFELPCAFDSPDLPRVFERQARMPFNVTGTPAIAVPTGFTNDGLPLGMQIAGPAFGESIIYKVAWAYCEAAGWTERFPPEVKALI